MPKLIGSRLAKPINDKSVERNIIYRAAGYSFQVRLRIHGVLMIQTFDTLPEARAYRDRIKADASLDPAAKEVFESRQRKREAASISLTDLLERYRQEVTPAKKGATVEGYRIKKLESFPIAKLPIYSVNREAVLAFCRSCRAAGMSDNNLRKYLMLLSSLFKISVKRWGMSLDNPIQRVEVPSNGPGRDRRLRAGEWERLLAAVRLACNGELAAVFEFAVETACRRGEIVKLDWRDVDLQARTAKLRGTKNGEDRLIPLSGRALAILKEQGRHIAGPVFASLNSNGRNIRDSFETAKRRARKAYLAECVVSDVKPASGFLEDLRFHDLRHEATSRLFEKGLNVMEASSITGHKTLAMLKRYTHLEATQLAAKLA